MYGWIIGVVKIDVVRSGEGCVEKLEILWKSWEKWK